jgi:hypothetical protein
MIPRWQKARLLPTLDGLPHLIGQCVWVENRPPFSGLHRDEEGRYAMTRSLGLAALQSWHPDFFALLRVPVEFLELLPEFSDAEFAPIPFAVWSAPEWQATYQERTHTRTLQT